MYIHTNKLALSVLFAAVSLFALSEGVFVVGFYSKACDSSFEALVSRGYGGLIFYTRNLVNEEYVKSLTRCAREHGVKIIAIDHEGTFVNRFRYVNGFIPPNAMALGSTGDPNLAYLAGYYSGLTLRRLGFNVDLAPVLDVNSNPRNPVIGVRSFWSTPDRVIALGLAFMKGLYDGGVLPVVKHFPGHGDTDVDSHTGLPVIDKDFERFREEDLEPFVKAVKMGAPAVMTAHVIVGSWDRYPATLSKRILGYLRNDLGFKGLIFSDDMTMKAVWIFSEKAGVDPIVEAFRSGVDVLLVADPNRVDDFVKRLDLAVGENPDLGRRLREVERRIRWIIDGLKPKVVKTDLTPEGLLDEVARRSIAAWRGEPLKVGDRVLLLYPENFLAVPKGYEESMRELKFWLEFNGVYVDARGFDVKHPVLDLPDDHDTVLVLSVDLFRYPEERRFVEKVIRSSKRSILVAIRSPYDLLYIDAIPSRYAVTYDWNGHYPRYLVEILTGKMEPLGEFVSGELGGM